MRLPGHIGLAIIVFILYGIAVLQFFKIGVFEIGKSDRYY